MDDAVLVQEAVAGSVAAFTEIFERYEAQVHDAALALLRDKKAALAVTSSTFEEASERLETLKDPSRLLVWLLAITRYSTGLVAGEHAGSDRQPAQTDDDAERAQQAALVWEATADLPMRERALLDFHLRQGLDGDDLADALGVSDTELGELRAEMEPLKGGLAGYLLMRGGGTRCPDLPLVLRGWDGHFTPLVCTHIGAHVAACRVCREAAAALPSPLALYAATPQAPLPVPNRRAELDRPPASASPTPEVVPHEPPPAAASPLHEAEAEPSRSGAAS